MSSALQIHCPDSAIKKKNGNPAYEKKFVGDAIR